MTSPTPAATHPESPSAPEHLTFAPGSQVLCRGELWLVRRTRRTPYGDVEVHATGLSELVRGKDFVFLTPGLDEVIELEPERTELVGDDSPGYRKTRLYLESLLRASPPTDPRVHLGHKAAMDAAPYQLVPAAKALAQPRPRILIADAVGLGKTIEAGVLLTELIRRGRGRRILVVALKSVLEQIQQELWARFTIPLVRLDSEGLARVQRKLPANANPFYYFDRVIISIDTLKKDEKYRRFLEDPCHWDVTLIDECQHVAMRARHAGGKSQRARLAELLARTCDALVLTSATPHDGRPESFASLMNLLEPTAVADVDDYGREDIQGLYVRRFKKDIADQTRESFRSRELHRHTVGASTAENGVFETLADAEFQTLKARGAGGGVLFRTTLLKGMLSSPQALLQTIDERSKKLEKRTESGSGEDLALLKAIGERAHEAAEAGTTKLDRLVELLRAMNIGPKSNDRVVVFSERLRTLELLETLLPHALSLPKEAVATFHGSLDDSRQQRLVKQFGTEDGAVRVLLCSDAAAEGINLHFYCHRLVHFDIPWSLITLEQRNGRIDRFGQKHTPEIHYLLTEPGDDRLRGDLRILDALVEKEKQAHDNLGDARWLLDLHEVEKEEDRIALAISRREAPEDVLPDLEDLDLDDILAAPTDLAPSGQQTAAETGETRTLYASELAFWKDASHELEEADLLDRPTWHDDVQGVSWPISEDLDRRFEYLPPELRREAGGVLKLTADPALVQRSLTEAREKSGRWPEWQFLWPLHPVAAWIEDRVLASYARHEAPVLRHPDLGDGEALFVMQGVLSNQVSQPVVIDWFGVVFAGGVDPSVLDFDDLEARASLRSQLGNDGRMADVDRLRPLTAPAVEAARQHMRGLRLARAEELRPLLRDEHQRLASWRRHRLALIEARRQKAEATGRKLRRDEEQRLDRKREDVERRLKERDRWIKERLSTVDAPYVRIAAVLADESYFGGGDP